MKRPIYQHHPPYRIFYIYDCNFDVETDSLEEAIRVANEKHPEALIVVSAGPWPREASLHAWQVKDKPLEEVYEMFDKEIDEAISRLAKVGMWPEPNFIGRPL